MPPMVDTKPKVSICLPVHNGARYLGAAIESVQAQTEKDFELLIADDNSTDGSVKLVEVFARLDPRIKLIRNEQRLGLFGNYNFCIQQARGTYIKLFGQDDLLDPNCLAVQTELLERHKDVQVVSSARRFINELGKSIPVPTEILSLKGGLKYSHAQLIKATLFPIANQVGEPVSLMFRRDPQVLFDPSFHQLGDLEFAMRLTKNGQCYITDKPVVSFRVHADSSSSKNTKSIAFVSDILRLAEIYKSEITATGCNHQEYLDRCTKWMGDHISALFDSDRLTFSDLTTNAATSTDEAEIFRLAAFMALKNLGALNRVDSRLVQYAYARNLLISRRERELRKLMRSRSWRLTKPLRDIKRAYWGNASVVDFDQKLAVEAPSSDQAQRQYLSYLRKQIMKLKRSASWQITRSLRIIQ